MANASNFSRGFTPASNPERGNNIMGNAIGVYLCYVMPGEESVKRFERSNGLDTALYKTTPLLLK